MPIFLLFLEDCLPVEAPKSSQNRIDRSQNMRFHPSERRKTQHSQFVLHGPQVVASKGEIVQKVPLTLCIVWMGTAASGEVPLFQLDHVCA
jgi:hypothetical protein